MENITEWVGKFEKNTRNKPNQQLQKELFHRIRTPLMSVCLRSVVLMRVS